MKVIANSLPKSGTHLIARALELAGFEQIHRGLTGALIRPTSKNPLKNMRLNSTCRSNGDEESYSIDLDDLNNKITKQVLDEYLSTIRDGQFVTSHIPYSYKLDCYLYDLGFRMIYIVRDPRDVLVSLYHYHLKDFKPYSRVLVRLSIEQGLNKIYEGMTTKGARLSPLAHRVRNSIGWLSSPNVLPIRFEDLIGEKGGASSKVQCATIDSILEFLSLEKSVLAKEIQDKVFDVGSQTFNKGKIRQYPEILQNYQIARLEGDLVNEMNLLRYTNDNIS